LQISVLLAVPPTAQASGVHHALNLAKVLVHRFDASSGEGEHHTRVTRVTPTPLSILLETQTLSFSTENSLEEVSVELPQVYKQTVSLFRSLFTLLRTLPAWKLQRKLRRARQSSSSANLSLVVRVVVGRPQWIEEEDVAGFSKALSPSWISPRLILLCRRTAVTARRIPCNGSYLLPSHHHSDWLIYDANNLPITSTLCIGVS
jgi:hypothetical protein